MKIEIKDEAALQKFLERNKTVSIPMLQLEYNLTYSDAKKLMAEIISRDWAVPEVEGVYYSLIRENIVEVHLSGRRLKRLNDILDGDCFRVIVYLHVHGRADFDELVEAVIGEEDTTAAIETLTKERIIRLIKGHYYLSVSKKSAERLNKMAEIEAEAQRRILRDTGDSRADIEKKFRELFDNADKDNDDDDDD